MRTLLCMGMVLLLYSCQVPRDLICGCVHEDGTETIFDVAKLTYTTIACGPNENGSETVKIIFCE